MCVRKGIKLMGLVTQIVQCYITVRNDTPLRTNKDEEEVYHRSLRRVFSRISFNVLMR